MKTHHVKLPSGLVVETENLECWPEAERLSVAEGKALLRAEAIENLRKIGPADVRAVLISVSSSGMARKFRFYGSNYANLTGWFRHVLGWPGDGCDWLRVTGCGMDMVWHTVDCVNRAAGTEFNSRGLL